MRATSGVSKKNYHTKNAMKNCMWKVQDDEAQQLFSAARLVYETVASLKFTGKYQNIAVFPPKWMEKTLNINNIEVISQQVIICDVC